MTAGTWAQMTVANQNSVLGVGSISGSMCHYAMTCAWNPQNKNIEIVGADHNYGCMRYVRFDGNNFVLINAGGGASDTHGGISGLGAGHEFNGLACNPTTGSCYYRRYGAFNADYTPASGQVGFFSVGECNLNGGDFRNNLPLAPAGVTPTVTNIVTGSCWWTGTFAGAGAQGCYVIFNAGNSVPGGSANDGEIIAYDPLSNTWFFDASGMAPFYGAGGGSTYHEVMAYSAVKNCAVYGGGNVAPTKAWRLNTDRSFTVMPDVPVGTNTSVPLALGIQRGNLVGDPVTGNFLLLSSQQLWELNPSGAGTWTQQTGARTPPPTMGVPGPAPGVIDGVISCPIPDYGVVAYIWQTSSSQGGFWLYKHA